MRAVDLHLEIESIIAEFGEEAEIEISVDVGSDENPHARIFARPFALQRETSNRHVLLAECIGYGE